MLTQTWERDMINRFSVIHPNFAFLTERLSCRTFKVCMTYKSCDQKFTAKSIPQLHGEDTQSLANSFRK